LQEDVAAITRRHNLEGRDAEPAAWFPRQMELFA